MKSQKQSWINQHKTMLSIIVLIIFGIVTWAVASPSYQQAIQEANRIRQAEKDADLIITTSLINSCSYDIWHNISNIYLNNGLHLTYGGNLNFDVGGNYTIIYHSKTSEMESWILNA